MRQARLDPSRTNWPVRGPAANHLDDYGGTAVLTGCSDSRVQGEKLKNTQPLMVCRCLVWVASCLVLQLSFHFRCMWEYTTSSHGLPIGAFFRGESARNAYRRNEDYSITKGNSTVVTCCADPLDDAVGLLPNDLDLLLASHFSGLTTETQASR